MMSELVTRRYRFKLHPSAAQAAIMREQLGMMVDLWNALKQRVEDTYSREKRMLSYYDLTNEITGLRHACPEWATIPAVTAHRVAKHLIEAYAAFFRRLKGGEKRAGYPKWMRRDRGDCIPLGTMDKTGWTFVQRADNHRSWRLHYKSVTEVKDRARWIHARGVFPVDVEEWRNADILWRDGRWWLSICVDMFPRRKRGRDPIRLTLDLIDDLAEEFDTPEELVELRLLADEIDELKSERDRRFPRGSKVAEADKQDLCDLKEDISRLSAYIARRRANCLHGLSARIVRRAKIVHITMPPIKASTKTGRGDKKTWGANVKTVAAINRNALSFAPAMLVQMIEYKCAEAGIPCTITKQPGPLAVGGELVSAGKLLRQTSRIIKKESGETYVNL